MANKKINQLVSKTAILSTDIFGIGDATTGQLFKKTIAELQAAIGGAVISVNGLVGTVVLDTDDIQELATPTNKYFTDARARGAISLTVTGNSGASTYSSGTGVLNVPTYTLAGLGGISATFLTGTSGISYNSTTGVISYSGTVYTDASIRALLSGSTGISYNSTTGAISYSGTVYTDSSVRALISLTTTGTSGASTYNNTTGVINVPNYTLAGLGGISLTSLSGGTGITYNNTTGAISYSGTVYTDASVRALISAGTGISYNSTTGVITSTITQYTDALARASISITTTGTSGASTYNSTTGVLNVPQYQAVLTNPVTGTGTTNYVAKFTSSSAIGNSQIFDNGTNLGINNTSPGQKLTVTQTTNDSSSVGFFTSASTGTSYGPIILAGTNSSDATLRIYNQAGTLPYLFVRGDGNVLIGTTTSNNHKLEIVSGATSAIRISVDSGTNGIGMSPGALFQIDKPGVGGGAFIFNASGNLGINNSSPSIKLDITKEDNNTTGIAKFNANNLTQSVEIWYAGIRQAGSNSNGAFNIDSKGSDSIILNSVNTSGNILLGTSTNNGERLYVSGAIRATSTITANSDIRIKSNITKIENALEKVGQISGYTYNTTYDDKRHGGVIAQEIDKVFPEIVNTGNDGLMGVEYGNISALLIEAIKEQNTKIKNLETLLASK
jgi:hypothetical protein